MQKSHACVCILMALYISASSGVMVKRNYSDPRNPGKCTLSDDVILSPGDQIKDPNKPCAGIICGRNGYVIFRKCEETPPRSCTMDEFIDISLPFPDCCMRYVICN